MTKAGNNYRVLIAGSGEKLGAFVSAVLPRSEFEIAAICDTEGQARRLLMSEKIDLLIISAPLKDDFGTRLAIDFAEENLGVLLMTPTDVFDQTVYRVEEYGVFTVQKPVTREQFYRSMKLLAAMRSRLVAMEQKNRALREKLADIRIVNEAKWKLVEKLHMTESDAHYFIEKKAMDNRQSRREVAENIIQFYQ